jgi:hypothetical protein
MTETAMILRASIPHGARLDIAALIVDLQGAIDVGATKIEINCCELETVDADGTIAVLSIDHGQAIAKVVRAAGELSPSGPAVVALEEALTYAACQLLGCAPVMTAEEEGSYYRNGGGPVDVLGIVDDAEITRSMEAEADRNGHPLPMWARPCSPIGLDAFDDLQEAWANRYSPEHDR